MSFKLLLSLQKMNHVIYSINAVLTRLQVYYAHVHTQTHMAVYDGAIGLSSPFFSMSSTFL